MFQRCTAQYNLPFLDNMLFLTKLGALITHTAQSRSCNMHSSFMLHVMYVYATHITMSGACIFRGLLQITHASFLETKKEKQS